MKTGDVSLFEKKGIFFKADVFDRQHFGNLKEVRLLTEAGFADGFDLPLNLNLEETDVEGDTGYVTGAYKDAGNVTEFPYRIKIWLLTEEEPIPMKERP